jgi:hypothetical protein
MSETRTLSMARVGTVSSTCGAPRLLLTLALAMPLAACGRGDPERLAQDMRDALAAGDAVRALALAELAQSPHIISSGFHGVVNDCIHTRDCEVTLGAYDAAQAQADADSGSKYGLEMPQPPEGVLAIHGTPRSAHVKYVGELNAQLPYATLDGRSRIIAPRHTAAKLAQMRATSNEDLVDELFAAGVSVLWANEPLKDWKTVATVLPDGGGEVAAWYVAQIDTLHRAALAGDLETLVASGRWEARVYAEQEWDGTPIPRAIRLATLRAQLPRMLATVKVLGGYRYAPPTEPYVEYVLLVEGRDVRGWIVRGPVRVSMMDGALSIGSQPPLAYPPAP